MKRLGVFTAQTYGVLIGGYTVSFTDDSPSPWFFILKQIDVPQISWNTDPKSLAWRALGRN